MFRNYLGDVHRNLDARDEVQDMLFDLENNPEDYELRKEAVDVYLVFREMDTNLSLYAQIPYAVRLIFAGETDMTLLLKALSWWIDQWEEVQAVIEEEEAMRNEY